MRIKNRKEWERRGTGKWSDKLIWEYGGPEKTIADFCYMLYNKKEYVVVNRHGCACIIYL